MNFTFLKATGEVVFFRSDAEQAEWTQEELSLLCTFPFNKGKVIERGMVVLFQDPATDEWHGYEIRNCTLLPGEYYQQFTAESLAVSELTDCHIQEDVELDQLSVSAVLQRVLQGTGWQIGTAQSQNDFYGEINRGSVWQAISTIRTNCNVYIEPRITVNSTGITGRYLDILSTEGVWRGVRLSVDKNTSDPIVTYDDSELYTALYGYGGSYSEGEGAEAETKETSFADYVWSKTNDHPAKPAGQKYLEYPEKTAMYGRNGKPRFGFYQNNDILSAEILLEKTWESLKACCDPKISITGTVTDLKRLGYNDEPLRLHDMAIVDLEPVGITFYKQIIQLTVNLLDPTGNRPTIGDYIPNIIYINRETESYATGGSKGRGGGTKSKKQQGEFQTSIDRDERNIHLNAQHIDNHGHILEQAGMYIDPITGVLIYAEDRPNNIGSLFRVQSDRITAEVTERKAQGDVLTSRITQTSNMIQLEVSERKQQGEVLASRITQTSNQITLEVSERKASYNSLSGRIDVNADKVSLVVEEKNGGGYQVKAASIVAGINGQTGSYVKIQADTINLSGYVTASELSATDARITNFMTGSATASKIVCDDLRLPSAFYYHGSRYVESYISYKNASDNVESHYFLVRSS